MKLPKMSNGFKENDPFNLYPVVRSGLKNSISTGIWIVNWKSTPPGLCLLWGHHLPGAAPGLLNDDTSGVRNNNTPSAF